MVLLKCAGDVQKVPTHKSLQVLYLKINKQQIKLLFVCIITKTITLPMMFDWILNDNLTHDSLIACSNI